MKIWGSSYNVGAKNLGGRAVRTGPKCQMAKDFLMNFLKNFFDEFDEFILTDFFYEFFDL